VAIETVKYLEELIAKAQEGVAEEDAVALKRGKGVKYDNIVTISMRLLLTLQVPQRRRRRRRQRRSSRP